MPTEPTLERDRTFRFGPFELSERQAELRKSGVRIKLQEQPFRVLVELVATQETSYPAKICTRNCGQPTPSWILTLVLTQPISKLRQALNDDAENPRYIETLAKRGHE